MKSTLFSNLFCPIKKKASHQGRAANPGTGLIQGFGAGPNKRQAGGFHETRIACQSQSGYRFASLAGFVLP